MSKKKEETAGAPPTHNVFIVFKNGAVLGPIPSLYSTPDGALKLVNDFKAYIDNPNLAAHRSFHLGNSIISLKLSEVVSVHLSSI
jgi:hypothetical protein